MSHHQPNKSVQWADEQDDLAAAAAAHQHQEEEEAPESFDLDRIPASQRWQYRIFVALNAATEWGTWGLQYGWVPFVAAMGMSDIYCKASHAPFQQFWGPITGHPIQ